MRLVIAVLSIAIASCASYPSTDCTDDSKSTVLARFESAFPRGVERAVEDIQVAFDVHKGAFFQAYTSAQRTNPTLRGVFHYAIAIRSDGAVAAVELVCTTMHDGAFEERVAELIRGMSFTSVGGEGYFVMVYPITVEPKGSASN